MSTLVLINIAIEISCSVMCLAIMACIMIGDNLRVRMNRVFIWVLLSNIALMLSDALAFYSIGRTEPHFFVLSFIGNFFTFQFSYLVIMCFSNYINVYLASKIKIKRTTVHMVYGVCGLAVILTFFSLLNNMYFIIDENNIYHRQSMYWLSQVMGMIGLALNSIEIIRFRKSLNRMETFALASYIVLPIIAVVIQVSVYGYVSVYIASTLTILFIYIGMQAQFQKLLKEKELQLTQSRIAIMISQIQPHFLYNALAVISRLCDKDPVQAKKATIEFSSYLRGNMDSLEETKPISFEKELKHIEGFISLEKAMYGEALNVIYDIKTKDFFLPALTVQSIVENAIKHGIGKREGGGTVRICTSETDNEFLVIVSDDGVGFEYEKAAQSGRLCIGINNVRQRLSVQCGGSLEIKSEIGTGTTVTISIPKL
jgi:two-component system, LytTR family, sensor kinase